VAALTRFWLRAVAWLNAHLKSAAVRLTRVTGKSRVPIHPKHLINEDLGQHWYLDYVEAGMQVLDVGCGNGMHGIHVAGRGATVAGLDYDPRQLQAGRALIAERGVIAVSFVLGSAEETLPFKAGQFDLVLALDVIEHLDRRDAALREIHRVLKRHGLLLVAAPKRDTSWKKRQQKAGLFYYSDPDHRIEYTETGLRQELERNGLTVQQVLPVVLDTPWAGLIDLVGGFSLGLYRRLVRWKQREAQRRPEESIGFRAVCLKE